MSLLQDFVAGQAERTPDAVAVHVPAAPMTYADLESQANQIARILREQGCQRGDRVCVLAPVTPSAVAALLGVLKADAIFVPLTATDAPQILARAVEECQPACVLTAASTAAVLDALLGAGAALGERTRVGSLERSPIVGQRFVTHFSLTDAWRASGRTVASRNRPTSPATLVFKNGSPARGVVATHGALTRSIAWAGVQFEVAPGSRHAIGQELAQDRALFAIMTALAGGGTLEPAPWAAPQPWKVLDFLRRGSATHWYATTADLAGAAASDVVPPADLPALRQVMWWTDSVGVEAVQYWTRRLSHARFTSLYGAPEAATVSAYRTWRDEARAAEDVPIGLARPGQDVVILNGDREPMPAGEIGEVWIRGLGLSPGYWGNPNGTAEAFSTEGLGAGDRHRMWRTGDRGRRDPDGLLYLVRDSSDAWVHPRTAARSARDLGASV